MTKFELFKKLLIVPLITLLISFFFTIITFEIEFERLYLPTDNWSIRTGEFTTWSIISANVFPSNFFYKFDLFTNLIAFLVFISFISSCFWFLNRIYILFRFEGFPSLEEAKKYYHDKQFLEKKKRLHLAKLMHETRLQKLEEEKKKFL